MKIKGIIELLKLKLKYGLSSSLATVVDYLLYLLLVTNVFNPVISNVISAGIGMIINFLLQKRFVFELKRELSTAFLLSIGISLIGISLSTGLIYLLNFNTFFEERQYITKALVTGLVFFYNFYMKRFAFEKRFL